MWTGCIWLKIGTSDESSRTRKWTFGFHWRRWISRL